MLSHNDLENYFQTNFAVLQYHKWPLGDLEEMMPFEKEIYVMLLANHLDEEATKAKQNNH